MSIKRIARRSLRWIPVALVVGLVVSCATSNKKDSDVSVQDKAVAEWNKTVKKHIPDEQRAQKLIELGGQMIAMQQTLMNEMSDLNKQLAQQNIGYDTTKAEADQVYSVFTKKKNASLQQYRDILFAMRKQTNEHEWKALVN